ncbi:DUF262 domain-containing protein [Lysobacter sp.]|uniref:DUF262 domain-containing protein n=1 Tax=Lysobacter sp. TaxID=72226 RepID=UPI002D3DAE6D|nr:DUF262 domain-containing protein [Lysobacter sp.]HZX78924.1 DUF262 domain-containing protein [Lysobacter sp.]
MTDNEDLEVEDTDSADDEAFITYEIAAYPADYTLSVIDEMWRHGDITVPTFQRKFVWSIKQSSLLIESLLMGLPVPQAFFYVESDSRNLVIDGLQRIMSIVYFLKGYFGEESYQGKKTVFRLTGLSERSPYFKKTYEELGEADKRKLRNRVLRVINIKQIGPKDDNTSAYHIFERLNTGGTPLTAQEIRHCVFHGALVDCLSELNKDANWRKILGKTALDKHQKDVELVLRVLAVATRGDSYEKPMKEFLNVTMEENKDADKESVKTFISSFPVVASRVLSALGEKPFNIRGRVNASALDAVMGTLMTIPDQIPSNLGERFQALLRDPEFDETLSVSTSDTAVVKRRLAAVRRHLLPG